MEATTAKHTGITLGKKLAEVGTEGGPPLAVPAAFGSAWQGVDGPEPFDSGNSDYERACDVAAPALISIGKGKGLVLDQQHVTVHRDAEGLLLHAYGDPAEADAKRWKRVGEFEVGRGGLVIQDAALSAKRKSRARATVPLAAGVYDVLAHPLGGFGNDFSAVRLKLKGAANTAKPTTTKRRGARTAKASARRNHRSRAT